MSWNDRSKNEVLKLTKWGYLVSDCDILPTRQHQLLEEVHALEIELGGMLRFQRDKEGRYP
jgi:hypothetical protein